MKAILYVHNHWTIESLYIKATLDYQKIENFVKHASYLPSYSR